MSTSHTSRPAVAPMKILQFLDGTQIVNPRFFYKIYEGYGYEVSRRFEGVGSGSSIDLYFENPAGSGREVFIVSVEVTSTGEAWIDVYRGNTVVAPGTALTPVNMNFEKNIPSVASVEYGGTYGLGQLILNTVCPGGSKKEAVGGAKEVGETAIIPPGFNFLVRVTNKSASAEDVSIRIIWWEEPA